MFHQNIRNHPTTQQKNFIHRNKTSDLTNLPFIHISASGIS